MTVILKRSVPSNVEPSKTPSILYCSFSMPRFFLIYSYEPLNQSTKLSFLMNKIPFNLQNNIITSLYLKTYSKSFSVLGTAYLPALLHFQTVLSWQMKSTFIIVIVCSFFPRNTRFCGIFWGFDIILFYMSDRQIIA